jgi:hypothetical protein
MTSSMYICFIDVMNNLNTRKVARNAYTYSETDGVCNNLSVDQEAHMSPTEVLARNN